MLIILYNFHIDKEQIEISMYWVEWLITYSGWSAFVTSFATVLLY